MENLQMSNVFHDIFLSTTANEQRNSWDKVLGKNQKRQVVAQLATDAQAILPNDFERRFGTHPQQYTI